jgi:hypothetical protein
VTWRLVLRQSVIEFGDSERGASTNVCTSQNITYVERDAPSVIELRHIVWAKELEIFIFKFFLCR